MTDSYKYSRARQDPVGRFYKFVRKTETCWIWTGSYTGRLPRRYGSFYLNKKQRSASAHRFMFELIVGPIAPGMEIDHLCRNTLCVNPDHLEEVTHRENGRRGIGPVGVGMGKDHCKRGHSLADKSNLVSNPKPGRRRCRICLNTLNRSSYWKNHAKQRARAADKYQRLYSAATRRRA